MVLGSGTGDVSVVTNSDGISIAAQVGQPGGERLASLAYVLMMRGLVMSACKNTSKKLVGMPMPELSKIANEKESGVMGSSLVVRSNRKLNGSVLLGSEALNELVEE